MESDEDEVMFSFDLEQPVGELFNNIIDELEKLSDMEEQVITIVIPDERTHKYRTLNFYIDPEEREQFESGINTTVH